MRKSRTTRNRKPLIILSPNCKIDKDSRELSDEEAFFNPELRTEFLFKTQNLRIKGRINPIKPLRINSFDVETTGKRNNFYLFGLMSWNGEYKYTFNKLEAINLLSSNSSTGNYFYATNLGFDFNAIVEGTDFVSKCNVLIRGNQYIGITFKNKYNYKVNLLDSFNYGGLSVEKMGKILKLPKLQKPRCLGKHPKGIKQIGELLTYNKRDCEVTRSFMVLFQEVVNNLGGNLKSTISSTAIDLFRRSFLEYDVLQEKHFLPFNPNKQIFKAYYGGRTEVFKRGIINKQGLPESNVQGVWFYGDINSLYPSVMTYEYPNPMTVKYIEKPNKEDYHVYLSYEGVSVFTLEIPYSKYPFLPYRDKEGKLLFPYGTLKNVSLTHLEVRHAITLYGESIIKEMKKTIYYTETKPYFRNYVNKLYALRRKYQEDGNDGMSTVCKLLLNTLYGRFALRDISRTKFISSTDEKEILAEMRACERKGIRVRVNQANDLYYNEEETYDGVLAYPIWSVYVTAYARIKMHKYIVEYEPVYTDTDSIITSKEVKDSKELGELKLEKIIREGIIIKPKLYICDDELKAKGIPIPKDKKDKLRLINKILKREEIFYQKFTKIKEAINRNIKVNSIQVVSKHLDLEDTKREWKNEYFNEEILEDSEPIKIM